MLIPNINKAWRMLSVQAAAAAVAFGLLDPALQAAVLSFFNVPAERVPAIIGFIFLAARLLGQKAVSGGDQ